MCYYSLDLQNKIGRKVADMMKKEKGIERNLLADESNKSIAYRHWKIDAF